jgi:hypothetical protein
MYNFFQYLFFAPHGRGAFLNFQFFIPHTVPDVYDVFAVAIKETVGFQQPQKCAGEKMHKGRGPTAFFRRPSPVGVKHIQTCYAPLCRTLIFLIPINIFSNYFL